jgi:hypothetical protein
MPDTGDSGYARMRSSSLTVLNPYDARRQARINYLRRNYAESVGAADPELTRDLKVVAVAAVAGVIGLVGTYLLLIR